VIIDECISWLTSTFEDAEQAKLAMQDNALIKDLSSELTTFMECEDDSVDLLNTETWKDTPFAAEFKKAEDLIWNAIALRAAHQQRIENLVQTAGHL
jgi:hypothetical protein